MEIMHSKWSMQLSQIILMQKIYLSYFLFKKINLIIDITLNRINLLSNKLWHI